MRRKLAFKLLGTYLIFGFLILFILTTVSEESIHTYLKKQEAPRLYRQAVSIASDFKHNVNNEFTSDKVDTQLPPAQNMILYSSEMETYLSRVQTSLKIVGTYQNAKIWITDSSGNLFLDSSNPTVYEHALSQKPYAILEFDILDFENSYYQTGTFYKNFTEETLTGSVWDFQ